jgi:hypothetical protein
MKIDRKKRNRTYGASFEMILEMFIHCVAYNFQRVVNRFLVLIPPSALSLSYILLNLFYFSEGILSLCSQSQLLRLISFLQKLRTGSRCFPQVRCHVIGDHVPKDRNIQATEKPIKSLSRPTAESSTRCTQSRV